MSKSLEFFRVHRRIHSALLALLIVPFSSMQLLAQPPATHHHYKLIALGTLGGPGSTVNTEPGQPIINSLGTVVGVPTRPSLLQSPGCYNPVENSDCYISHAFVLTGHTLKDLGTLRGGNFSYALGINQSGLIARAGLLYSVSLLNS